MPAITAMTLAAVRAIVLEQMNLSKGAAYGTFDNSPLYKADFIRDCIFEADEDVVSVILATPGHPRRVAYSVTLAFSTPSVQITLNGANNNRGVVAVNIEVNGGQVRPGVVAPLSKISEWISDETSYGGPSCVDGYYNITDGTLIFTGVGCSVDVVDQAGHEDTDVDLFAPPEYMFAVVRRALKNIMMKDPSLGPLVNNLDASIQQDTQLIMASQELPVIPKAEGSAQ